MCSDCAGRFSQDFGFGFEMIIACMKLRSRDSGPHIVADDFVIAQLANHHFITFGERQLAPLWL
jgi:hypothetical protein